MASAILPIPQVDVSVREATTDDVPFIDQLQREHQKQVGFLARSWIENKINAGQVLVAEEVSGPLSVVRCEGANPTDNGRRTTDTRLGYIISQDKYLKREELGLVVQLCVVKGVQRKLIGATLLKAAFERAAYGCRLFCLWCAQDIEANRLWEAMGFVPLAYRAGSERKARVHIFWQKRIRQGDDVTPWWFPSSTGGGAMREDRIVLPIPPGKHWADEMPVMLPPDVARASRPRLEGRTAGGTPAPRGGNAQAAQCRRRLRAARSRPAAAVRPRVAGSGTTCPRISPPAWSAVCTLK